MAKTTPPANVAIASLDARKQTMFNLMAPGPGTPWEDRGSVGVVGAFFKTAFGSMFKPAQLLDSIRRPETGGDSFSFAIGCGLMWSLSALVHGFFYYKHLEGEQERTAGSSTENQIILNAQLFWMLCGVAALLAPVVVLMVQKIGAKIYFSMVATEMKSKAPPILAHNIYGYCLGPSVLAPIPFAGPVLAVVWSTIALVVGGVTRLKISTRGAVVGSLVSMSAMVATVVAVLFVVKYIPPHSVTKEDPVPARGRR
jgi:hypothetical protein